MKTTLPFAASYLLHSPTGLFVACVGFSIELSDNELDAPIFTPENLGRKRGNDFHLNFLRAARKKFGRKNVAFVLKK